MWKMGWLGVTLAYRQCHHSIGRIRLHMGRLKMREWKIRYGQNCKGGKCRSKLYGTPTRDYIEKALSYFVILVLIFLTEQNVPVIALKIVSAFVFEIWWIVSDDVRVCNFLIISNASLQSKERHICTGNGKQENNNVQK